MPSLSAWVGPSVKWSGLLSVPRRSKTKSAQSGFKLKPVPVVRYRAAFANAEQPCMDVGKLYGGCDTVSTTTGETQ